MKLSDSFPFIPRGNQEDVLEKLESAFSSDKKFIILQAPTGLGKSVMALASSKYQGNSYILTVNKILQDQYQRDFSLDMADLRGRANYKCLKYSGNNCANAPCRWNEGAKGDCEFIQKHNRKCEYAVALDTAKLAHISSLNFAAGVAFLNYVPGFTQRNLLVIDEGHLIEDALTNLIEFKITEELLDKYELIHKKDSIPEFQTSLEYKEWLTELKEKTNKKVNSKKLYLDDDDVDTDGTGIEGLNRKLGTILTLIAEDPDNLIVDFIKDDNIITTLSFRPVSVARFANQNLYRHGKKVLIMSATIVDFEQFMRSAGIPQEEAICIDVDSTFPSKNRPFIKNYVANINNKNINEVLPKIKQEVEQILKNHWDEKGMIHTHSYNNAKYLYEKISPEFNDRLLFPKNSTEQANIISEHSATKRPTVMISPSMTEGVDLKDDLARFQIIVKVPYPYLGDKIVKARMTKNPDWYSWRTMLTIIQSYGRSTRSETDHSIVYILDGNFETLLSKTKKKLPKWFLEAIL